MNLHTENKDESHIKIKLPAAHYVAGENGKHYVTYGDSKSVHRSPEEAYAIIRKLNIRVAPKNNPSSSTCDMD